jgi:hypothetical protein
MYQLRSIIVASLLLVTVPAIASTASSNFISSQERGSAIALSQKHLTDHFLVSQAKQEMPIVQTEDWTGKDVELPWNQLALHKTSSGEEKVVFTKSSKFKLGWISSRKERIRTRWTQKNIELFITNGQNCGVFGCLSSDGYGLPKRINVTVNGQDYFLNTVQQNTYELTPELKQAIDRTSGRFTFTIDKRINFEIQEEAVPALKRLFTIEPKV